MRGRIAYVGRRGERDPRSPERKVVIVSLSVGILSTYPPTQCGLATFSAALAAELVASGDRVGVVRLVEIPGALPSTDVVHHLLPGAGSSGAAAAVLNRFDAVIVQHEFGVYGGADGDEILDVLDDLRAPVIVVLHTVLTSPSPHQRQVLERVVHRADAVVTMTGTARDRLLVGYRVDAAKVEVIPHGAAAPAAFSRPRPAGPPVILTWGLLGPGKGIESAIDALAELRSLDPPPRYRVVGQTHPRVLDRDGESYRRALMARAAARDVADLVTFHPAYLDSVALSTAVAEADIVVLPYESRQQVTSGVLIEAVAAGKPVVATAFPHAIELLADGAGLVVPHGDPGALAAALRRLLTEPTLRASMTNRGARVIPQLLWPAVSVRYQRLARQLVTAAVGIGA